MLIFKNYLLAAIRLKYKRSFRYHYKRVHERLNFRNLYKWQLLRKSSRFLQESLRLKSLDLKCILCLSSPFHSSWKRRGTFLLWEKYLGCKNISLPSLFPFLSFTTWFRKSEKSSLFQVHCQKKTRKSFARRQESNAGCLA